MDETASSVFFSRQDYVTLLGSQIHCRKTLGALCLVNKTWNAAFSPVLYSHVRLDETNAEVFWIEKFYHLLQSPYLQFTRTLEFHFVPDMGKSSAASIDLNRFNMAVRLITERMPGLRRLICVETEIYADTLMAIHESCPLLEHISRNCWASSWWLTPVRGRRGTVGISQKENPALYLCHFSELKSLSIHGFRGEISLWTKLIVNILLESPGLTALGLSMHIDTIITQHEIDGCPGRQGSQGCLDKSICVLFPTVCREYIEKGGQPLRLQSLVLGLGMTVSDQETPIHDAEFSLEGEAKAGSTVQAIEQLSRVVDLSTLRHLSIFNHQIHTGPHALFYAPVQHSDRIWCVILAQKNLCSKLDTLSFSSYKPSLNHVIHDTATMAHLGIQFESLTDWTRSSPMTFEPRWADLRGAWGLSLPLDRDGTALSHMDGSTALRTLILDSHYLVKVQRNGAIIRELQKLPNLEHLWLRCPYCVDETWHYRVPKKILSCVYLAASDKIARRMLQLWGNSGRLAAQMRPQTWLDFGYGSIVSHCKNLRYLRTCDERLRVVRTKDGHRFEQLGRWEDEFEAPDFFRASGREWVCANSWPSKETYLHA
ncbi:hypothetical protein B0T24DRAFT_121739 [Lasiosphaeria ovina]|uniref:Uncharacterized protein n=1 Tax=Lasiosphaeria ovina TaxID=92902 RepID=A0AAE0MYH0_9PEZI|nr:hypothetical protein B0T24DRAFT_121739 [Lasiosphaeria ovina]